MIANFASHRLPLQANVDYGCTKKEFTPLMFETTLPRK